MTEDNRAKGATTPAENFRAAVALHQRGRLDEAARLYEAALDTKPADFDCLHNLGLLHAQQGKFDDAVALFCSAVGRNPNSIEALTNLGNALAILGRHEEAVANFERVLRLAPSYADAHNNLGIALQALGRHDQAIEQFRKALAINPWFAKAYNNLGNVLEARQRPEEAISVYEKALALNPNDAAVHNNIGVSLASANRREEAIAHYQKAIALSPNYAEAHNNIGAALEGLNRHEAAVTCIAQALALNPNFPEAHNNLGNALRGLDRHDEALASYRRAVAIKPDYAPAHGNMGDTLRELGRAEEARRAYETAIRLAPKRPHYYRRLAELTRFAADDPVLGAMSELAREEAALSQDERIELQFALAKAFGELGEHERAFGHLIKGNALRRRQIAYDEAATLGLVDRIRAVFTPQLMSAKAGLGHPSRVPIFVVGMIRSGTTLVEQILASHPEVYGAGELTAFAETAGRLGEPNIPSVAFPESFVDVTAQQLVRCGADYCRAIKARASGAEHVIDKMPANFRLLGPIHLALPNARMIHVRRDPVDTCLSCFSILFAGDQPFAYELGELGRYYRAYAALMEHWLKVVPQEVMLEVQYEELVRDVECEARRIVAHCGLEWDARCLAFYETERPVRTASAFQIRRPIYASSIQRWRPNRDLIQPLLTALNTELN